MKKLAAVLMLVVAAVLIMGTQIQGGEKEKTYKGTVTCAKCDLKLEKACATVLVVKKGDKETVYYFDKASNKKYHKEICTEAKKGSVTGVTSKKGDKHFIKVSKVEFE
jgi:hypothetical protein